MISTRRTLSAAELGQIHAAEQVIMNLGGFGTVANVMHLSSETLRARLYSGGAATRTAAQMVYRLGRSLMTQENQ